MFAGSKILTLLYLPSWMNLAGYWFNLAFHLSLTLGSAVVLPGVMFLRSSPPEWVSALYAALDRPLVAICFSVFMLGCFVKCKSGLRDFFEWRGFHFLGRLSYCVFVLHFIVLRLILAGNTQLNHASIYSLITLLISVSVLSYIVAIPICLLVELPAIELWRACTQFERKPPVVQQPQSFVVKPLDLVANIRRRQDV
ncbi:unnamed protein product [Diatraea saccharalis]|uniref:Acyltransferase 3 domain-containing protein n=1 Tax=Diatraea saccharalis TaxID=40085 RepID=A0A9N9WI11_9NEOP|nr:unnamed protein product [Diatraea saccharalis]